MDYFKEMFECLNGKAVIPIKEIELTLSIERKRSVEAGEIVSTGRTRISKEK